MSVWSRATRGRDLVIAGLAAFIVMADEHKGWLWSPWNGEPRWRDGLFAAATAYVALKVLDLVRLLRTQRGLVGWSQPRPHRSFWEGSTRAMRIASGALCVCALAFLLRLWGEYIDSLALDYLAVVVMVVGLAVFYWAVFFVRD